MTSFLQEIAAVVRCCRTRRGFGEEPPRTAGVFRRFLPITVVKSGFNRSLWSFLRELYDCFATTMVIGCAPPVSAEPAATPEI
jgi:hypothetical protein